jgi:hypothetical protein
MAGMVDARIWGGREQQDAARPSNARDGPLDMNILAIERGHATIAETVP